MYREIIKNFVENISCDYYLEEFKKIDEGKATSWNWAAFFFGPAWYMYRKMYLPSFLYFILLNIIIIPLYTDVVLHTHVKNLMVDHKTYVLMFLALSYAVFHGALGNIIYHRYTKDKDTPYSHEKYQPVSIILGAYCLDWYVYCFDGILWLRYYMHSQNRYYPGLLTELNAVYATRLWWLLLYGFVFLYFAIDKNYRQSCEFAPKNIRLLISPKASWKLFASTLIASFFVVSTISTVYHMGWMIFRYFHEQIQLEETQAIT